MNWPMDGNGAPGRGGFDPGPEAGSGRDIPGPEGDDPQTIPAAATEDQSPAAGGRMVSVRMPNRSPLVAYAILGLTIAVFLLQLAGQSLLEGDYAVALGAKVNEAIRAGQWWRLLTPVLLHGSVLHIAFNMMALHSLGPGLEGHYGHGRFLALYLLGAFGGNVLSFLFSEGASVGASTAIFGLFAAEAVFLYVNGSLFGPAARQALRQMGQLLVINLLISLTPGIDLWGHLGGLLAGGAFALLAGPKLFVTGDYPDLRLADSRTGAAVGMAGALVLAVFAALAAWGLR